MNSKELIKKITKGLISERNNNSMEVPPIAPKKISLTQRNVRTLSSSEIEKKENI